MLIDTVFPDHASFSNEYTAAHCDQVVHGRLLHSISFHQGFPQFILQAIITF